VRAGDGHSEGQDDSGEEADDARASSAPEPEHTDVHDKGSRLIELLQDVVAVLLAVTLLGLAFVFLWRVWQEIVGTGNLQQAISGIIYVFITVELYRLAVHYLKYHRVDLNTLVEVGVAAIIQKVVRVGVDSFTTEQLIGISLILATLGAILWVYLREIHYGRPLTSADAEVVVAPVPAARENRDDWKATR
jgi:uncharacterized membrane protein (DUF373 family)